MKVVLRNGPWQPQPGGPHERIRGLVTRDQPGWDPLPGYRSDVPQRPGKLDKQARREARDAARVVAGWSAQAQRVRGWTDAVHEEVRRRLADVDARAVPVAHRGETAWRVTPLSRADAEGLVRALVDRANLPRPSAEESAAL